MGGTVGQSFIDRFVYAQGNNEVPPAFYRWAGISLISACLQDHIYFEKFKGSKLVPNLYTILIGPSGLGKGLAIDAAIKFIKDRTDIHMYRGKATAPHLIDHLGRAVRDPDNPQRMMIERPRIYLITPELSMSVGSGNMADMLVKLMTELYTGGDYLFEEGTRTNGAVKIKAPLVNWFAGSTEEWLAKSISKDAIEGGFFARVCAVQQDYDFTKRIRRPQVPVDYEEVMEWLHRQVDWLTQVGGPVILSPRAEQLEEHWYQNREVPTDTALLPSWKREHDMVLKLAMIFMMDELPKDGLVIKDRHMVLAQQTTAKLLKDIPQLITLSNSGPESEALNFIRRIVLNSGEIPRQAVYFMASSRGLTRDRVDSALDTLTSSGEAKIVEGKIKWARLQ